MSGLLSVDMSQTETEIVIEKTFENNMRIVSESQDGGLGKWSMAFIQA